MLFQVGIYLPCYDIFHNLMENFTTSNAPILTPYVPLVAGSVARSLACVSCYPIELARTRMQVYIDIAIDISFLSLFNVNFAQHESMHYEVVIDLSV